LGKVKINYVKLFSDEGLSALDATMRVLAVRATHIRALFVIEVIPEDVLRSRSQIDRIKVHYALPILEGGMVLQRLVSGIPLK
jgi:hypothetical protein